MVIINWFSSIFLRPATYGAEHQDCIKTLVLVTKSGADHMRATGFYRQWMAKGQAQRMGVFSNSYSELKCVYLW